MPAVPGLRSSPRASSLGGSARLTAWRLFIRRQRQRELLADAGAFVLQGFCSLPPGLPPISPAPGPFFRLHAPMHHPNPGRCWSGGRGPQPRCPPCRTCHKATGMPDGCHAPPHSQQPPLGITRRTAEGLEVAPQRWLWAGGGWAPDPGLCCSALCQPGWGASPKRGPARPLPGEALAAGSGTGTSLGGRLPPSTSGKGTIPGHFFFGRPLVPPPLHPSPSSSCARARGYN